MPEHFTYATLRRGQPLHTVVHLVDQALVDRFRNATGEAVAADATHDQSDQAHFAPPGTASIFSTMVLGNPGHDRPAGDIHARHDYEFLAPIPIGTEVTTSGHVTDLYMRNGRKWVEFVTLSRGPDGEIYAQCRCTIVVPE